jgi:hypothetical protein
VLAIDKNRDSIFSRAVLRESGKRREEEREKERARGREKRYRRQEPVYPYFRLQRSASSEKPLFVGTFI